LKNHQYRRGQVYADDVVLVKIKPEKWDERKIWEPSDFPDINIKHIRNPKYSEYELEVYLKEFGDEKVNEAIVAIEKYDIVESVSKVRLMHID
jgi:hypothetical protein